MVRIDFILRLKYFSINLECRIDTHETFLLEQGARCPLMDQRYREFRGDIATAVPILLTIRQNSFLASFDLFAGG